MSWRLSADALDYSPYDGRTLLVLISLASWADDDGSHIFPRVETLANKARCSVRQAQRALRQLEQDGVLVVVRKGGGRSLTEYKIDVEKLRAGQGCQNGTGDTSDVKKAENVTPEVTKPARHIDTRSLTRSSTRSLSPAPAGAGESEAVTPLGVEDLTLWPAFRAVIADTWPNGFPKDNEAACKIEFGKLTRSMRGAQLVEIARLHGQELAKRKAMRPKSANAMLFKAPASFLRSGEWEGYIAAAEEARQVEGRITSALGRVRRGLGPELFEWLRNDRGMGDPVLAALDGVTFEDGPQPRFLVTGGAAKVLLEGHMGTLHRRLGDDVEIRLVSHVRSA